jgi:hypothetical protein
MLMKFFAGELSTLIVKATKISFPDIKKTNELQSCYKSINQKCKALMKSYAANITKLLKQTIEQQINSIGLFFDGNAALDIVRICLPFSVYCKKLS